MRINFYKLKRSGFLLYLCLAFAIPRAAAQFEPESPESRVERMIDSIERAQVDDLYDEEREEVPFTNVSPRTDSVQWRNMPDGYIQNLEKDKAFEYVKTGIPKPQPKQKSKGRFSLNTLILWIAVLAFVGFIIWYLIDNNIVLFRRRPTSVKQTSTEEDIPEDIFSINYKEAIQKALDSKNFRLAIRLQYLQLLKNLSDRNIIKYRPDKTNFDYLMQLRPTDYYNDFFTATRNYEYSWYGLFDITEDMYQRIEPAFSKFYKNAR